MKLLAPLLAALLVCLCRHAAAAQPASMEPPMVFSIVRSAETGCEPLCPEWIAAEGRITRTTPLRLQEILRRPEAARLPIVISSTGGIVQFAMASGALIRRHEASIVVGRTNFTGCNPQDSHCQPGKPEIYGAIPQMSPGYCHSACPFILAGGVTRTRISTASAIGVHQIIFQRSYERKGEFSGNGGTGYTIRNITKIMPGPLAKLKHYFTALGIEGSFIDLMQNATPNGMYLLTDEELAQTRLINAPLPGSAQPFTFTAKDCHVPKRAQNCVKR